MRITPAVRDCNSSGNTLIFCEIVEYLLQWKKRVSDREGAWHLFSKYANLFAKCHFEIERENKLQLTCYMIHIKRKTVSNSLSNCSMTEPKLF